MDFSRGWAKPGSLLTKARLELARPAVPQAIRRRIVGSQPAPERREQGSHQRLRLPAFPA